MTDQLVTFETAKLAFEKGFNHMESNCYGDNMAYQLPEGNLINALSANVVAGYILAPTRSLLQRWLREVHNILLFVNYRQYSVSSCDGYYAHTGLDIHDYIAFIQSKTYEECLEIGLKAALNKIIC
jgi:hypothetical protein